MALYRGQSLSLERTEARRKRAKVFAASGSRPARWLLGTWPLCPECWEREFGSG